MITPYFRSLEHYTMLKARLDLQNETIVAVNYDDKSACHWQVNGLAGGRLEEGEALWCYLSPLQNGDSNQGIRTQALRLHLVLREPIGLALSPGELIMACCLPQARKQVYLRSHVCCVLFGTRSMDMAHDDIYGNWTKYRDLLVKEVKARLENGHTFRRDVEEVVHVSLDQIREGAKPETVHVWEPDQNSEPEGSSVLASSDIQTNHPTASGRDMNTMETQPALSSLEPTRETTFGVVDVSVTDANQSFYAGAQSGSN